MFMRGSQITQHERDSLQLNMLREQHINTAMGGDVVTNTVTFGVPGPPVHLTEHHVTYFCKVVTMMCLRHDCQETFPIRDTGEY